MNTFWDKYYKRPLKEIPWQNTQDDWFKALVDSGKATGQSALDLGCGIGMKSIYLALHAGFQRVVGVDISEQALEYARSNAAEAGMENRCSFISHDLTNWAFLKSDETFDLILDWAAIHCLPADKLDEYARNITQHCAVGGKLLVRSFASKNKADKYFEEEVDGVRSRIFFHSEKELSRLFSRFNVIARNTSQPQTKPDYYFIELLMQKG